MLGLLTLTSTILAIAASALTIYAIINQLM